MRHLSRSTLAIRSPHASRRRRSQSRSCDRRKANRCLFHDSTTCTALAAVLTLAGAGSANAAPVAGLRGAWGSRYSAQSAGAELQAAAGWTRRDRVAAALEPHRDRRERPRPHAGRRRREPRLRRAARARPREPRDGHRAHRDVRRGERDRRRLPRATPACAARRAAPRCDAAIAQAAHDTLVALFPSQAAQLRRARSPRICAEVGDRQRARRRHRARAAGRRGDPRAARRRRLAAPRAARRRRLHPQRRGRASGARIRSARSRSRSARTGARSSRSSLESADQFRVPPPPAMDSAEYAAAFDEVKRLGGDGIDTPTERTAEQTLDRHLLGLRRHAEPVRAAAALQPDRGADRRADGHDARSSSRGCWRWSTSRWPTPASRSGSRSTTTRSGVRSPASARPTRHRPDRRRRRQPRHRRRSDVHAARRAGEQPRPGRTSRRPSRPIRPVTPASAARSSRRCAASTAPTTIAFTFVSDEFNGVTDDNDGNVRPLRAAHASTRSPQAEEENGQSRIYLGIHWAFDKTAGHRAGPARRRLRVRPRPAAAALTITAERAEPALSPGISERRAVQRTIARGSSCQRLAAALLPDAAPMPSRIGHSGRCKNVQDREVHRRQRSGADCVRPVDAVRRVPELHGRRRVRHPGRRQPPPLARQHRRHDRGMGRRDHRADPRQADRVAETIGPPRTRAWSRSTGSTTTARA